MAVPPRLDVAKAVPLADVVVAVVLEAGFDLISCSEMVVVTVIDNDRFLYIAAAIDVVVDDGTARSRD